ncbi:MAG: integrase [Deltaproteobacteria bacterium]|nr:MAG: integrase [Deltaproteobacteria bacterium]
MADALRVIGPSNSELAHRGVDAQRLVDAFLGSKSPNTLAAYRADLRAFQAFVGASDLDEAAGFLLGQGPGEANAVALEYRTHLVEVGLAASTVNRRLASLRSLVKLANTLGLLPWELQVKNLRAESYRDTRGPGSEGFARLLVVLADRRSGPKAVRDRAIVRLLYDLALRRAEVVGLDVEHVDLGGGTVEVQGKGRTARLKLTLPEPTRAALAAWLAVRGREPGPLFTNFDRARKGQRLTGRSVHRMVSRLGREAGITARPHGLRHASITAGLDLTNGDVRAVQRFSRHRNLNTVMVYDDARADLGGQVARLVAKKAAEETPERRAG